MLGLKHTAVMSKLLHLCIEGFLRHVLGGTVSNNAMLKDVMWQ